MSIFPVDLRYGNPRVCYFFLDWNIVYRGYHIVFNSKQFTTVIGKDQMLWKKYLSHQSTALGIWSASFKKRVVSSAS
jgi:hypothetical protein